MAEGRAAARRFFGTDGVRGVVGETLTDEFVERLGRAATLWSGRRSRVARRARHARVGACARGRRSRAGSSRRAARPFSPGVLPTPAVALLSQDLGLVVSASHNPPEYNGVKVFDREGHKLSDADELEIEALLDTRGPGERLGRGGGRRRRRVRRPRPRALRLRPRRPPDRGRLRERRVLGDRARRLRAPRRAGDGARERARTGRTSTPAAARPISGSCRRPCASGDYDLGVAFDGDGDRMLAVDERGEAVDGDQILAICALSLGVRARRRHDDDEPRVPSAHGRARDPRRHDRRRRPVRPRGAAPRGRHASAASSRAT